MRIAAKDHLGESRPLVDALVEAGHTLSPDGPTDLFLIDIDTDQFGYRDLIDFYRDCGAVVVQYPHGALNSSLSYDNLFEPYALVDGQLTNGRGEIDFLRSIGVERPAKVMGWQLCTQFEFRSNPNPRRVVYAPTHANGDGSLDPARRATNSEVFRQLLEGPWELVVRYLGADLECIGLWHDESVFRYVQGNWDMTTVEIDSADCVVAAAGTYPCLALARGVPAIMYGQFATAMYGLRDETPQPLRNVDKYRDIMRYPFDAEDGNLSDTIREACSSEGPVRSWRDAWVGKPFDAPAFASMMEEWIPELRANRREPVTA